jgi:hypothetical protein
MTNIITFSTNLGYERYATILIKSLRKFYNDIIICRCVNCSSNFIEFLKLYNVEVIVDDREFSKEKKVKNLIDTPVLLDGAFNKNSICTDETTYTCHSRFYNIIYALDKYTTCTIFAIDCDFIAIKDFNRVFDIGEADIAILDPIECVHEDGIVIRNTKASYNFISKVISKLEENIYFWDQDTLALRHAFEVTSYIKVKELDIKYKDYNLSNNSYMWSGDGQSKYTCKYKSELAKYE